MQVAREGGGAQQRKFYAVKEVQLNSRRTVRRVKEERMVMARLELHPFIVQLHYALRRGQHVYFVMDFMPGGDLYTVMRNYQISKTGVLLYISCIALALKHCHSQRVVHRDLKPENVLLGADGHVKLADFGLARVLEQGSSGTRSVCGTEVYTAPEMLARQEPYAFSVDYWQFGCFIYELFCGHSPFYPFTEEAKICVRQTIAAGSFCFPEEGGLPSSARSIIYALLTVDFKSRLGFDPDALTGDQPEKGWRQVMCHRIFDKVDWATVLERRVQPPVRNVVPGRDVLQNFDDQFVYQDTKFRYEEGVKTPWDSELLGFNYHGRH